MHRKRRKPWILCLPISFQANPLGLILALMFFIVGLTYALGTAHPGNIADLLNSPTWLRLWGASLCVATGTLAQGIYASNLETEKLGLRLLSLTLVVFALWILLAVGVTGALSVAMCGLVIFFCQLRIGVIKQIQHPWIPSRHTKADDPNGS